MHRKLWCLAAPVVVAAISSVGLVAPAEAHPHQASVAHQGAGQELANGANHGTYSSNGTTCGGDAGVYGLETAHHGPDSGTPGASDGCYQVDSMPPGSDDANPAID